MEKTKDKIKKVKPEKEKKQNKKSKIIFIILILIFILLATTIVIITYKIIEKKKPSVEVSGVMVETSDYSDVLLVEVTKQTPSEETNTTNPEPTTPVEPAKPASTTNKNTVTPKPPASNNKPYYIKVNYTSNVVTIYSLDANGNYTVPVKAMLCSSGSATPRSGAYATPAKYRWALLMGNVWGQYSTRITGGILFHSVPYNSQNPASLKANYYDKLGLSVSAGCIRLTVADAKWIYDNCPVGTLVEFYSSSNPGPLGKPTTMKISGYPSNLNCWDPTDPNPNNPWIQYFNPPVVEQPKEEQPSQPQSEPTQPEENPQQKPSDSVSQQPTENIVQQPENNTEVNNNVNQNNESNK